MKSVELQCAAGNSEELSCAHAQRLDEADPLAAFGKRYARPRSAAGDALLYLCGHSLGLAPLRARALLQEEMDDWERLAVLGHEHARRPWIEYSKQFSDALAQLTGAGRHEVVAMNSLTANLHLMMASFYRPADGRDRILIEAGAFPSDRYAVISQLQWHGVDPRQALIEVAPRAGEALLRSEDIEAAIAAAGARLALVLWPGVQYLTGQAFELASIARAAHRCGALAGFDLAHSIGNVPLSVHDWDADFAVWCSYKYLNGGPGAIAGAFVHERHSVPGARPRLCGWWGNEPATRFAMAPQFQAAAGADGWQLSNPPIFACAPLLASLEDLAAAGMPALRAKSVALTGYLERALRQLCGAQLQVLTPTDPQLRGCQLSLRIAGNAARCKRVFAAASQLGLVGDWREPDVIRLAPVPLYNSFFEVLRAAEVLAVALREQP
ncbi:MAG TPA: kynureninase [Steroidobacteraceae bacterium]